MDSLTYHFNSMIVNDEHSVRVQEGIVQPYIESIIFWMGTPPSDEDLEPKPRLQINWNQIAVPVALSNLEGTFRFEIHTIENKVFIGNAIFQSSSRYETDKYTIMSGSCIVTEFKEV